MRFFGTYSVRFILFSTNQKVVQQVTTIECKTERPLIRSFPQAYRQPMGGNT